MRRAILTEALSAAGLHFFCGGEAVIIDAFTDGEFAMSAQTASALMSREGKYRGITAAAYTEKRPINWAGESMALVPISPHLPQGEFQGGVIELTRIGAGANCVYHLSADGRGILVCGGIDGDGLTAALDGRQIKCEFAFVSPAVLFSAAALDVLSACGIDHIFVHRIPADCDDEFKFRLNRRLNKLSRKGLKLRVIDKFPAGIII